MDPLTMALMMGTQVASSFIGGPGRLKRRNEAKSAYDTAKKNFSSQDFSNVFANMENPYEDLTVNQTAAQFQHSPGSDKSLPVCQSAGSLRH